MKRLAPSAAALLLGLGASPAFALSYRGPLQISNNLSEIFQNGGQAAARANLGLGSVATQSAAAIAVTGGTINGTAIGGSTPAAGNFTTLSASSLAATGGTIDGTVIGGATPAAGSFTALSAIGGLSVSGGISATGAAPGTYTFGLTGNPANLTMQVNGGIAAVAGSASGSAQVLAADVNYYNNGSSPTFSGVYLRYFGSSATGTSNGLTSARQGQLVFQNVAAANIATNGPNITISPLGNSDFVFTKTGQLGIGTLSPAYPLDVVGEGHFSGGVLSDGALTVTAGGASVTGGMNTDTLTVAGAGAVSGQLTANGNFQAKSTMGVTGLAQFQTAPIVHSISSASWAAQGAVLGWNITGGGGETDFVNSKGGGAGGFSFYNVATGSSNTPTLIGKIDGTGSLLVGNILSVSNYERISGAPPSNGFTGTPGSFMGFNYTGGQGESDFFNATGGAGGFNFYHTSAASGSTPGLIASLDGAGDLSLTGGLTVNGAASVTGALTAPTAPAGTNTTQVATTAFVSAALGSFAPSSISYTASGTGAQPQNVQQKLQQIVNAADFMTPAQLADIKTGNPTLDVGSAINAALASLSPNNEGTVMLPCGVLGDSTTIVLDTGQYIKGCGPSATIIRALASSTSAVIATVNFASLINTSGTTGAPYKFGIADLTVDGNNVNRSGSEDDIDIYGFNYTISDTEEINAPGNGIFSQFGSSTSPPAYGTSSGFLTGAQGDSGQLESLIIRSKQYGNTNDGILYEGPTDATITHDNPWNNGQYGLFIQDASAYSAGGTHLIDVHGYYNGTWNFGIFASDIYGTDIEAESGGRNSGGGIIVGGDGALIGSNINVWNNPKGPGISFNNTATPSVISSLNSHGNGGDGIDVYAPVVLSAVNTYGNGGNGLTSNTSATQSSIAGIKAYGNANDGIFWASNLSSLTGIVAASNSSNGVEVPIGVTGVRLNGQLQVNAKAQFAGLTTSGNNTFDFNIYYQSGETAYSGSFQPNDKIHLDVYGPSSYLVSSQTEYLGSKLLATASSAPTISSGFGSNASIQANNGTAAFVIYVGTSPGSSGTIGMPTASDGWACDASDLSNGNGQQFYVKESAMTTSSVTFTNLNDAGSAANFGSGDYVIVKCSGF